VDAGNVDPAALRRALVVVCEDEVLAEQIRRDMHITPARSVVEAEEIARERRSRMNGQVSAVVPNYNYSRFIGDAIDALLQQTRPPDEIIVVDDASTDGSADVVRDRYGDAVRVIEHDRNSGTVGAPRNTGIAAAKGEFIVALDSDDMLEPTYIETLMPAIADKHNVGVVYSGVQTRISDTGQRVDHNDWPPPFDWRWQTAPIMPPRNCIPVASMFRREMWQRAGGYDGARRSAEDCDYWVRGVGAGFDAVKATAQALFVYRRHGPSMSGRPIERMDNWNAMYRGFRPLAAPTGQPAELRDYTRPTVSVIIPVGPGHAKHVPSAITALLAQTLWNWEVIVVNDSGETLPLGPYPFARVIDVGPRAGVSAARNAGLKAARGPLAFFLDADDVILPRTLEKMARRYAQGDTGYVYSGWWYAHADAPAEEHLSWDWRPDWWIGDDMRGIHSVSVLMATEDALRLGGFDEAIPYFEDGEFFMRAAIAGLCGARVPDALVLYRMGTGERRRKLLETKEAVGAYLREAHGDYIRGEKEPMPCCGGNAQAIQAAQGEMGTPRRILPTIEADGAVMMRFVGPYEAPVTYFGTYVGCKNCEPVRATQGDVERLEATGMWQIVKAAMPTPPEPALIEDAL
jgi:glycosyltransferase involved in cell wall biosynthesis